MKNEKEKKKKERKFKNKEDRAKRLQEITNLDHVNNLIKRQRRVKQ